MMQPPDPKSVLASPLPERTSLLLEASAGTGKTYTIAHLCMRWVAETDTAIDEILVVTFTEAAAAELREGIRERIQAGIDALRTPGNEDAWLRWWAESPLAARERDTWIRRLCRALERFDSATISTIHGFCHRVLTQATFESGSEFGLELLTDTGTLLREIVHDYLSLALRDVEPALYLEALQKATLKVSALQLTTLAEQIGRRPRAKRRPAVQQVPVRTKEEIGGLLEDFTRALDEAISAGQLPPKGQEGAAKAVRAVKQWIENDDKTLSKTEAKGVTAKELKARSSKKKNLPPFTLGEHPLPQAIDALLELQRTAADRWALELQHAFIAYLASELPRRKEQRGAMTYSDLIESVANGLMRGPQLAEALRDRYKIALIDEFQDTDEVQWEIFGKVFKSAATTVALVGDPKQAIYAFRGADLNAYLRAREEAEHQGRLGTNFRTDKLLVEAIDGLFLGREKRAFHNAELRYEGVDAHHSKPRLQINGRKASRPLRIHNLGNRAQAANADGGILDEHAWIARDIDRFLRSKPQLATGKPEGEVQWKDAKPKDCAVLVRSHFDAGRVQDELRRRRIPAVIKSDLSVFATQEGADLALWLKCMAKPGYDQALRAFLSTPLVGKTAPEVARLLEDEKELGAWAETLSEWRALFDRHGPMRALRKTALHLSFERRCAGEVGGERRLANFWHLAELIHTTKQGSDLSLDGLLRWYDSQKAEEKTTDETRQVRLETDDDAVEILTIHRSKGLEFPAVWCASLYKDTPSPTWPYIYSESKRQVIGLVKSSDVGEKARRDQFEEMMRLAYVALTRARMLCCVTWFPPKKDPVDKRYQRLSPLDMLLFGTGPGASLDELGTQLSAAAWAADSDSDGGDGSAGNPSQYALLGAGFPEPKAELDEAGEREREGDLVAARWEQEHAPDSWWRWSSFSSMVDPESDDTYAGADEYVDDESAPAAERTDHRAARNKCDAEDATAPANLAGLRGGTQLGNLLHKLLEITDFTDTERLAADVEEQLVRHGLQTSDNASGAEDVETDDIEPNEPKLTTENLLATLHAVLNTPIPLGGDRFCLRDLDASDCVDEMDFALPLAHGLESTRADHVTTQDIAKVLAAHARETLPADYAARLEAMHPSLPMRGFLNGAIDLVFRRNGRYYVADYKSNNLGEQLGHYAPNHLVTAMSESHYHLQAQLYVLALHRMLKTRMKDYDPAQHLGGCFYFFLRGMKPGASAPYGIYFDPTPLEAVQALEQAICGEERQ